VEYKRRWNEIVDMNFVKEGNCPPKVKFPITIKYNQATDSSTESSFLMHKKCPKIDEVS